MNKKEFLDILREALKGEVTQSNLEQNILYYDQYIGTKSKEEEEKILQGLGDPRLIAKSIVEAERISKQKKHPNNRMHEDNDSNSYDDKKDTSQKKRSQGQYKSMFNLKWYHKLIAMAAIIIIGLVLILVGRILIGLLFAFGLPILLILLLYSMFRR